MNEPARIVVISLGGTIAMTDSGRAAGLVPQLGARDLLSHVESKLSGVSVVAQEFRSVPSVYLTMADVLALADEVRAARESGASGVVITQGTDTLEETAFALDLMLDRDFPVVLTGAMRGADRVGADGSANLMAAIAVAADAGSSTRGVLAVLNDEVHAARWVTKAHTSRLDAFASPGGGAIGCLIEGRVRWNWPRPEAKSAVFPSVGVPGRVLIVPTWLGDDGELLRAAWETNPHGLVIEGLGAGHVPPVLIELLNEAAARVPIMLASSVGSGEVHTGTYGYAGGEIDLLARGIVNGRGLSARKARIYLSLALGQPGFDARQPPPAR